MIDREKIIKGIERCVAPGICIGCPYWRKGECVMKDAIELLKADQVELIRQRERIESLERIVDHLQDTINEKSAYFEEVKNESLHQG